MEKRDDDMVHLTRAFCNVCETETLLIHEEQEHGVLSYCNDCYTKTPVIGMVDMGGGIYKPGILNREMTLREVTLEYMRTSAQVIGLTLKYWFFCIIKWFVKKK